MILHASGTQTATVTTEHSLATAIVPGKFSLIVDLSGMLANDVTELRAYQITLTGGTKRLAYFQQFFGVPSPIVTVQSEELWNDLADASSLEWTLKQTFGTGRDYPWKVLRVTTPTDAYPWKITGPVKVNTALAKFQFLMTDSTNHAPLAGLGAALTATRSIDGGAFAAGTLANPAEVGNGTYTIDFGAGDLNGSVIVLKVTGAGADTTFERLVTFP